MLVCLSVWYVVFVCLSVCLSVNTYIFKEQHYYILVWPKLSLSLCLFVCLFVCLSIHIFLIQDIITVYAKNQQVLRQLGPKRSLSVCLSVCMYVCMSIIDGQSNGLMWICYFEDLLISFEFYKISKAFCLSVC